MKKIFLTLFFLSMYVVPLIAQSDTGFLGVGAFQQWTTSAPYDKNAKLYSGTFELDEGLNDGSFWSLTTGTFSHFNDRNYFAAGSYAWRTRGVGFYVQGNLGLAYLNKTSIRHGTNEQFYLAMFAGYKTDDYNVRLGWEHLSNGAYFIGTPQPNAAEDFLTLSIGVPFKTIW